MWLRGGSLRATRLQRGCVPAPVPAVPGGGFQEPCPGLRSASAAWAFSLLPLLIHEVSEFHSV